MADDRERGAGPGVPADGPDPDSPRTGPPSVPTRVVVDDRAEPERRGGVAPTMVPLARKRAARRTLRPGGSAAETEPMRDLVAEAAAVVPETTPASSERPSRSPRGSESAARSDDPPAAPEPAPAVVGKAPAAVSPASAPTVAAPVPPAVPPEPAPAVVGKAPAASPASAPTVAAPVPAVVEAPAADVGPPEAVAPADRPTVRTPPADLPTVRTARPPLPPPPAPVAPPVEKSEAAAPPAPARRSPAPRSVVVPASQEFAATSAVLAGAGASLRSHFGGVTWARTLRVFVVAMSTVTVLACGLAWGATSWFEAAVRQIAALDPTSSAIVDPAAQAGDQNFLVVGSDTRVGAVPTEEVGDASDVPGARSDTVMVVHVPADRSRVTVISFPRDLEIVRPACNRWDPVTGTYSPEVVPRTPQVKLNTAYQAGGPLCVTKTVQEMSGLAVNHFLGIDFQGFKGMVDAVDGVRICVDRPIRDSVLGTVVARAGPTVLSGDQALSFVRARHVEGDPTSDYGRIQRQQRFLGALLRETLSAGTLLDVGRLRDLVAAVGRSTFGDNVAAEQLFVLGRSLGSVDPRAVAFTSVPTTGTANGRGNEVLRPTDTRALFSAVIGNRPLPGQDGAAAAPATPAEQVTVRLARAGDDEDDSGAATGGRSAATVEVAAALRAQGFRVVIDPTAADPIAADPTAADPTAADSSGDRTVIRFSPDLAPAAATLARSVPGATTTPVDGAGELALSLATDVEGADDLVVTPTPAAPVPTAPVISAADAACA